jgi:hypothetical protein
MDRGDEAGGVTMTKARHLLKSIDEARGLPDAEPEE